MKVKQALLMCLTLLVCASGCGTMLVDTNRADAEIYLDGVHIGTGQGEADATGFPKTSVIRVEAGGEVIERRVKRRFTTKTAIVGLFTYLTGFLWAWDFPDRVSIHFSKRQHDVRSGWGPSNPTDSWSQPLYRHESTDEDGSDKRSKEAGKPNKPSLDPWNQPINPPRS